MRLLLALLFLSATAAEAGAQADNTPPTAVLTAPATAEVGDAIPLSGTQSTDVGGTVKKYRWTVGSRPVVETNDPTFNAPGLPAGSYSVSLVVVDDSANESAPDTETVLVRDTRAPTAVLSAPASVATNESIALSGSASTDVGGTVKKYRWTVGSRPVVETNDATFNAPGLPAGSYSVSLVVVDDSGNESAASTKTVLVRDTVAPTAILTAPAVVEVNTPVALLASKSTDVGGTVKDYRWTVGTRPVVVTSDPSFTAAGLPLGAHTVSLTVVDNSGNESAATTETVISRDTRPPAAVLTAPSTAVMGTSIALSGTGSTDVGGTIVEYRWTVGSRPVVVTSAPSFTAPGLPAGTHQASLVVVDDSGNASAPVTKGITVSGVKITKLGRTTLIAPVGKRRPQLTLADGVLLAGRVVSADAVRLTARFSARIGGRRRSLGRTSIDVPAGGFAQLKVTLPAAMRRALAGRERLKVVARVKVGDAAVRRVLTFEVQ